MIAAIATLTALTATYSGAAEADVVRYAVVVGNNIPLPGKGYEPLRYADDDAFRFAELFDNLGAQTALLAAADQETARRFEGLTARAALPTRARVLRALTRARAALKAQEGQHRELYFVFSGHGSISSTGAYLHLLDEPFSRIDLFDHVLKDMPAERIHVIIDSCHSYFLVNARGERVRVTEDEDSLERYPTAGFLLSTSDRTEVQEWAGYRAGVFSYQVLGALRGAADVDNDGAVTYDEVHAYVAAANLEVRKPEAKIQPFVRKPSGTRQRVVDLSEIPRQSKVRLDEAFSGHFQLASDDYGPVLDAHKGGGSPLAVVLPRPGEYFVRRGEEYFRVASSTVTYASLAPLSPRGDAPHSKGSIADEFRRRLFVRPLTPDFVVGLSAASTPATRTYVRVDTSAPWTDDWVTLTLLGSGVAGLVMGGVSTAVYLDAQQTANARPVTADTARARDRAQAWQVGLTASFVAGGILFTGGVLRALLVNEPPDDETFRWAFVGPGDGPGLSLSGAF